MVTHTIQIKPNSQEIYAKKDFKKTVNNHLKTEDVKITNY